MFITACAYRDEGEIDYRRARLETVQTENNQNETIHIAKLEDKNRLNTSSAKDQPKNKSQSNTSAAKVTFDDGDKMVIRLMTAFIKDYTEGPWSILNDALFEGQLYSRGEIAILAAVAPLEKGFDFKEDAHKRAQVVFYSNDVVAGQFLNFNNMPIYGPNSEGVEKGIGFALWIMEVDTSTPIVGALLSKLAQSFSGSDALGSKILEGLGEGLLGSGETSDVNFLYRVSFVPPGNKTAKPSASPLAIGDHVFIRAPKTRGIKDINWAELRLDENTKRLYKCPYLIHEKNKPSGGYIHETSETREHAKINHDKLIAPNLTTTHVAAHVIAPEISPLTTEEGCIKYRENNYLVIQISRNTGKAVDMKVVNETFEDFTKALEKNKGYNQVTAGIAKLKRQSLLDYIRNYRQRGTDKDKCGDGKVKIANGFNTYWDTYIRQSFIQYLKGVTTNDIVLNQEQLGEVLTELSSAINAVKVHTDATAQYFVLPAPAPTPPPTDVVNTKRDNIRQLILGFDCPYPKSP